MFLVFIFLVVMLVEKYLVAFPSVAIVCFRFFYSVRDVVHVACGKGVGVEFCFPVSILLFFCLSLVFAACVLQS